MKDDAFKNYVDVYSADLSRWPVELVKPALAHIETSPAARAYFDQALALDDAARQITVPAVDLEKLEARIMQSIQQQPQSASRVDIYKAMRGLFAPAGGGLFAALVLGFMIGFSPVSEADDFLNTAFYNPTAVITAGDTTAVSEDMLTHEN